MPKGIFNVFLCQGVLISLCQKLMTQHNRLQTLIMDALETLIFHLWSNPNLIAIVTM